MNRQAIYESNPAIRPNPQFSWSRRQWLTWVSGAVATGCGGHRIQEHPNLKGYAPPSSGVPGTVIAHSPKSSGLYIGSPSLAVLSNGDYVASHDFFGPASKEFEQARSRLFRSSNHGRSWEQVAEIQGAFWSSLFVHREKLYLLGLDRHHGRVLIRRSEDGGDHWTDPKDSKTGVLRTEPEYHCAPVPVLEHAGRLWRAFEWRNPPEAWGIHYRAGVLSAPVDADLLDAEQWTSSQFLPSERSWNAGDMGAWLEGNVVVGPDGNLMDLLRVDTRACPEKAALVRIQPDGRTMQFDPSNGFVDFPGGAKKFTVRFDPKSRLYWSLSSIVPSGWETAAKPARIRNTLALVASPNLRDWSVRCCLLHHPDHQHVGFQYVDWLFEGQDIIAICRTAFEDGQGGAHNAHDANFLTFHRVSGFRQRKPADSVPVTRHLPPAGSTA